MEVKSYDQRRQKNNIELFQKKNKKNTKNEMPAVNRDFPAVARAAGGGRSLNKGGWRGALQYCLAASGHLPVRTFHVPSARPHRSARQGEAQSRRVCSPARATTLLGGGGQDTTGQSTRPPSPGLWSPGALSALAPAQECRCLKGSRPHGPPASYRHSSARKHLPTAPWRHRLTQIPLYLEPPHGPDFPKHIVIWIF